MGDTIAVISLAGTSYYIASYARALTSRPNIDQVRVIVPPWSPETDALNTDRVELITIDMAEGLVRAMADTLRPQILRSLVTAVVDGDPDIIHIMNEMRFPPHGLALLRKQTNCPIVLTVHEPNPYMPTLLREKLLNPLQITNIRLLTRYVDQYIVHCNILAGQLARHVNNPEDIAVIPHGTFANTFTKDRTPPSPTSHRILFFGRAAPGKGLSNLINAAPKVIDEISDSEFIIAGKGYDPNRFGEVNPSYFTVYNDRVSIDTAANLFLKAAIVVLPYRNASTSGIISIAGGFRRPVVATAVGCFPEMIDHGETGLLVPPNDSEALAQALIALLRDETRRKRLGTALYNTQNENWNWNIVAEKTCRIYNSMKSEIDQ